jgi:hypothetical protein
MNRLLGYSLMSIGLLGFFFFLNYKGATIPVKELWFVLSIFTLFAGGYFFAKYKLQKLNSQRTDGNSDRFAEIERLKRIGEKVRVTLDNAEVKTRSYNQEIISEGLPSRMEILDGLYDSNRNYKTLEIQQTYIVFYKQYSGMEYKFVSNATTQNVESVKMYIDRHNGVDLFIDPKNPTNYYFDLHFG